MCSRERLLIARAGLALLEQLHELCLPSFPRGQALEGIAVYLAVTVGHLDHGPGPMTATKIAHVSGLSRTTVSRRLAQLMAEGTVRRWGDLYLLDESRAEAPEAADIVRRLMTILGTATETDSDTLPAP